MVSSEGACAAYFHYGRRALPGYEKNHVAGGIVSSAMAEAVLRKGRESAATKEKFFSEHARRIAECCVTVHGTVNDLAVGGAIPKFPSAAFILEEGLPIEDLSRIVASMREACAEAGVELVTGDTKVVDKGKGDQVFITTSGLGIVPLIGEQLPHIC
jgi:hydrogenase maturation factor